MLFAKDMKRMAEFYHEGFGLPFVSSASRQDWVEFDAGGVSLVLHALPPRLRAQMEITTPPRAREETPIKLIFSVDDLEQARRHLASRGATMFEPRSWGACDGLDPEGNVFQIVTVSAQP
jgi:predicted enzyme related to lactoylglutathione lyase